MSAFNVLHAELTCPSCGKLSDVPVQFKYGSIWQHEYALGDAISWGKNDIGEPGHECVVADGVAGPCPHCRYEGDWDVDVRLERDRLVGVEPRSGRHDFVGAGQTFLVLTK